MVWPLARPGFYFLNQRIPHALFYDNEFTGILRHNLDQYTEDENSILPKDEKTALKRYERRKEFVNNWYIENRPWELLKEKHNWLLEVPGVILTAATFPVSFPLLEWIDDKNRSKPESQEKIRQSNIKYEKEYERLHQFIIKDCNLEKD